MKKIINYTLGLTAIMVIAFCYSKKETKIRVLKSAEILFNLNEGSLRRIFYTAEKEISKVNGSSSDLFTSKETKNLPPHSSEAWNYYKEICLHDEYGGTNKKFKWKRDVKIYVHGSCRDYMMDELDRIVKDLNRIINTIEIKVVKNRSEANTFIFLGQVHGEPQWPCMPQKIKNDFRSRCGVAPLSLHKVFERRALINSTFKTFNCQLNFWSAAIGISCSKIVRKKIYCSSQPLCLV
jgi:hypothetical protein